MIRAASGVSVQERIQQMLKETKANEALGITEEAILDVPQLFLVAPSKLVITLTYTIAYSKESQLKIAGGIGDESEYANVSVIPPGMPENKVLNISTDDMGKTHGHEVYSTSKAVTVQGPPTGNYTIKLTSSSSHPRQVTFGIELFDVIQRPSIKIEGDGTLLVDINYPPANVNSKRKVNDSWMFSLS
jgi:hypothetical protein